MRNLITPMLAMATVSIVSITPMAHADLGDLLFELVFGDGTGTDQFGRNVAIFNTIAIVGENLDDDNGDGSGSVYIFDISDPAKPLQITKILSNDGSAGDGFGSVAINGSMAIIGASNDDDNGAESGSAYLFDISNPAKPLQLVKILPSDGETFGFFGGILAIGGESGNEVALVGRVKEDDTGSVFVFDASVSTPCPWDLDKSGSVDTADLLALFSQWGTPGAADFDKSGAVDTADLLILFANWGPCK